MRQLCAGDVDRVRGRGAGVRLLPGQGARRPPRGDPSQRYLR